MEDRSELHNLKKNLQRAAGFVKNGCRKLWVLMVVMIQQQQPWHVVTKFQFFSEVLEEFSVDFYHCQLLAAS